MNRGIVFSTALLACSMAALAFVASAGPETPTDGGSLAIDVRFDVSSDTGTFTATAQLIDLETGDVIAAPRVTSKIGQEATARSSVHSVEDAAEIVLTFWADESVGTYSLEITKSGKVVSVIKSSIHH